MRDPADELEAALGHEVRVRPAGRGIAVEIRLADIDEALALAQLTSLRGSLTRAAPEGRRPAAIIAWLRAISSVG